MSEWFSNNWGTLLVALILVAVVVIVLAFMHKDKKKGKSSCGGSCSSCSMNCHGSNEE